MPCLQLELERWDTPLPPPPRLIQQQAQHEKKQQLRQLARTPWAPVKQLPDEEREWVEEERLRVGVVCCSMVQWQVLHVLCW